PRATLFPYTTLFRSDALLEPGVAHELQRDRCECLVDLDDGDVVPAEPGPRERAFARLRVPVQHQVRIDARKPERDEPRAWLQAEPRARRLARDQDRRRPVADLARVPCRD